MAGEPFGPVVIGVDASTGMAAVDLAAEEALVRAAPLIIVNVHDGTPSHRFADVAADRVRAQHPAVSVSAVSVFGAPVDALTRAAAGASLLVLDRPNRRGSAKIPAGAVVNGVVQRSEVPVLLYAPCDHPQRSRTPAGRSRRG